MTGKHIGSVGILYPGDEKVRRAATPDNNRLATVFSALIDAGLEAVPVVYDDSLRDVAREQMLGLDAVLVWRNPIQDGSDRSILDPLLREVAGAGVFVSTHPDVIMKIGTKEVLYATRGMGWGCDTHLYRMPGELREGLTGRLGSGPRVLKQFRGNGGNGVWRVELEEPGGDIGPKTFVRVRHAKRGAVEEVMALADVFSLCEQYFEGDGRMIDQQWQDRLPEGMVRCYLTRGTVVGFGHQEINALYPAPSGADPSQAPLPTKRLYYPPDKPEFQDLKRKLEGEWVEQMRTILDIDFDALPILWDCDFMFGPKDGLGRDTYVLCEINVSSVAPYPESAPAFIAQAVLDVLGERKE